ncbi:unnamed protein product [Durusdinium trenchii]|uniref:Uncharacterized protein n=2 Tax=Durusdinium trenchii TaxID=1381693 RepID=A0ABP0PVH0_9DINO
MEALRKWLRQELLDADEESRTWRLRAIQAEAELRALQVESKTDDLVDVSAVSSDEASTKPQNMQVILGQVLGLEKYLKEWETERRAKRLEDTQAATRESQQLQARLDAEKVQLPRAEKEAKEARLQAEVLQEERAKVNNAHHARISETAHEIHELLLSAGVRKTGDSLISLEQGESAFKSIQNSVKQLEEDVKETGRKREELCMRLEELLTRHLNNMETKTKSAREVQAARQAVQGRQTMLTKLQGEVSRSRARLERKRKQLEGQLSHATLEQKDASERLNSAGEALRKVRNQHSKQLRSVKSQTSSLQAEVDAHLQESEAAEREMQELQRREAELESSEQRFFQQEEELREQAMKARVRLSTLEQDTERFEVERRVLLEELQPLEEELEQVELQAKALRDLADADELKTKEHQNAAAGCKEEIDAHRSEFASQADELSVLNALQSDVAELRKRRDVVMSERAALEDASKAVVQSLDQQLSDLREAQRRSTQLKTAHDEFTKLLPPSSLRQMAMSVAAEQALGRIVRKAEQLHGYLEGRPAGSGPGARRARPTNGKEGATGRLAEQLMEAAENIVKDELQECRHVLIDLQQKLAEGSARRGQEMCQMRTQRRQLEEELSKVEADVHSASAEAAPLLEELERHLEDLQQEAANHEATVAAEFADLLQQQTLERDSLKAQVEEMRRDLEITN